MPLLDLLRQAYMKGRVVDKYRLGNGSVGLAIEDDRARRRFHVEFRDHYRGPGVENLFGLLREPFSGNTEQLDRLVNEGDLVELTVSYSRGPLREALTRSILSGPDAYERSRKVFNLAYRSAQRPHYWGPGLDAPVG